MGADELQLARAMLARSKKGARSYNGARSKTRARTGAAKAAEAAAVAHGLQAFYALHPKVQHAFFPEILQLPGPGWYARQPRARV